MAEGQQTQKLARRNEKISKLSDVLSFGIGNWLHLRSSIARDSKRLSAKGFIVDPSVFNTGEVVADIEEIRRFNPQRHEMEQLSAVIYLDDAKHTCVGYLDVSDTEFWVRGHMPGMPLMPGVMMCEAAAQLASFYTQRNDLLGSEMVGFGGLEDVRFRGPVVPGDRLFVVTQLTKVRRGRMIVCRFQGIVADRIVFDGSLKGIPLPVSELKSAINRTSSEE